MKTAPALLVAALATSAWAGAAPLRVGYFYGQKEYDGEAGCRWLAGRLEKEFGARTVYFAGADIETDTSEATAFVIPNLQQLDSLDVLVLFVRRLWLNQAQLAKMKSFLNSGKGIVGIRAAQHAFQSWDKGFGIDTAVLGGAYNMHGPKTGYDLEFSAAAATHPILTGVKPWRAGNSLYNQDWQGRSLAPDAQVLMTGIQGSVRMPVTWTRLRLGANIFVTTTGVQEDFQKADFQRMLVAAALWAGRYTPVTVSDPPRASLGSSAAWYSLDGRLLAALPVPTTIRVPAPRIQP